MTFDEQAYLEANPDVARAISQGHFSSGQCHYESHGRREGRLLARLGATELGNVTNEKPLFDVTDLDGLRQEYLWLIKRCLTDWIYQGPGNRGAFDPRIRAVGDDWPDRAHTMIGLRRLDNLQACVEQVLKDGVPGDVIETGVWRGGAAILMRAILNIYGDRTRSVWVADSFAGLPPSDQACYPADTFDLSGFSALAVDLGTVKSNFEAYGLLGDQVRFLPGLFKDTLQKAPIERLAVLRLDGDLYESTIQALEALYKRVSPGGFVIVDDYGAIPACAQATEDFRTRQGITEPLTIIDWAGVFWRKAI